MKTVCIIQARMSSTRLKGKVLINIKEKPVLEHIVNRVLKSKEINEVIIATSEDKSDTPVVKLAKKLNINCIRGSLEDVLERYYKGMKSSEADIIVRITGDCPCVDYMLIDKVIKKFKEEYKKNEVDYMNNTFLNKYPRGYDIEVFTKEALEKAYAYAEENYEREHVTPYLYDKKNEFKVKIYEDENSFENYRVTLDTEEDLKVIKNIFDELYEENNYFGVEEVVDYLEKNPQISKINREVKQKKLGE